MLRACELTVKSLKGDRMKTRTILLTVAMLFAGVVVCFAAEDVNMGTWKLDEAKSKISPGNGKNLTLACVAVGNSVKVTEDGIDADGKPTHSEWTGKYDGKDYPLVGNPRYDTRAYKLVNDHTLALTDKKNGKIVLTGLTVISADGKTRTVTTTRTDPQGKKISSTRVYDKQ
jgi:hypothetical protein